MSIELDYQIASDAPHIPGEQTMLMWATAAVGGRVDNGTELTVRVVDDKESAELNSTYRSKEGPTNVLSFPFEAPEGVPMSLLGDIVICAPVVARQAKEQEKGLEAHWAHMVVHGCLHLLGYDHQDEEQAISMETLETEILAGLGYSDPYV